MLTIWLSNIILDTLSFDLMLALDNFPNAGMVNPVGSILVQVSKEEFERTFTITKMTAYQDGIRDPLKALREAGITTCVV